MKRRIVQSSNEQEISKEPTDQEIEDEFRKLANNRSAGENSILAEILKYIGRKLKERISTLIRQIWHEEQIPIQGTS
ncbi:hypothetical protein Trydic_g5342 [Trypoxylus dichotomus]